MSDPIHDTSLVFRLRGAVELLASSDDSLRSRLRLANESYLRPLVPGDFPNDMRSQFEQIDAALSRVNKLKPEEMESTAAQIVTLALDAWKRMV